MKRYIDEKDVYELVEPTGVARVHCSQIDELPRADVVDVVRCKDCAHYIEMEGFDYKGRKARNCVWHSALRGENDYCSDGVRIKK